MEISLDSKGEIIATTSLGQRIEGHINDPASMKDFLSITLQIQKINRT